MAVQSDYRIPLNPSIKQKGMHTLRIRPLNPGIVIEKILIHAGGLKPSYLGAPETRKPL